MKLSFQSSLCEILTSGGSRQSRTIEIDRTFQGDRTTHEIPFLLLCRMNSMCESPYLMKWPHTKNHCPNLVKDLDNDLGVPAWTRWGKTHERTWDSLAHVWSEFNGEYYDADFPRLIIRFEGTHEHDCIIRMSQQQSLTLFSCIFQIFYFTRLPFLKRFGNALMRDGKSDSFNSPRRP